MAINMFFLKVRSLEKIVVNEDEEMKAVSYFVGLRFYT